LKGHIFGVVVFILFSKYIFMSTTHRSCNWIKKNWIRILSI